MYKYLFLLLGLFCGLFTSAQELEWATQTQNNGTSSSLAAPMFTRKDGQGNVYLGYQNNIIKYDSIGNLLWSTSLAPVYVKDVAVDSAGNAYVAGLNSIYLALCKLTPNGSVAWTKHFPSSFASEPRAITVSRHGHLFVTGGFRGTVDFDPGPGVSNLVNTQTSNDNVYICQYDTSGNFVWAKNINSPLYDMKGWQIAVDEWENVYTAGHFTTSAIDFDPGPGVYNLSTTQGYLLYILKLDATGNFVWARNMGGGIDFYDRSFSMKIGRNGSIYLPGSFSGTEQFYNNTSLTAVGQSDIFVCKIRPAGQFSWVKGFGSITMDQLYSLDIDQDDNLYVAGGFEQTIDLNPGPAVYNLTSNGSRDAFYSKLDSNGTFVWGKKFGGANEDIGTGMIADSLGNICTVGQFRGTLDFDPGPGEYSMTSSLQLDFFVSKQSSTGNFLWAQKLSQSIGSANNSQSIAVDSLGNVYSTGSFQNTLETLPTQSAFNLTSAGLRDVFVTKQDSSGNVLWSKRIGGINQDQAQAIALDRWGNVYLTGVFKGTVDFNPDAGTANLTSTGTIDAFVLKLNNSGQFIWAKRMGGTNVTAEPYAITTDTLGNVYSTGTFTGTVDFDPGAANYPLSLGGGYVSKLDSAGVFVWAKSYRMASLYALAVDATQNIYVTGNFSHYVDADPGPGVFTIDNPDNSNVLANGFISKLDAAGDFVWGVNTSRGSRAYSLGIALDATGNIYTGGYFLATIDFDPGPGNYFLSTSSNSVPDVYLSKLDPNGSFIWAKQMGGDGSDTLTALALDVYGNPYITGMFTGTADFDPGPGVYNHTAQNATDLFVAKYNANGNRVWSHAFGGNGLDTGNDIYAGTTDVYATGNYRGPVDFDPGAGTHLLGGFHTITGMQSINTFVLKLQQDLCSNMTLVVDSVRNVSCGNTGQVATHIEAGQGTYSYLWNTVPPATDSLFMPTIPGIYQLTVTDAASCNRTVSLMVDGPTAGPGFDLNAQIVAGDFRSGFGASIQLIAYNDGCSPSNGSLQLVLDTLLSYITAVPLPDAQSGDTLTWNFTGLSYDSPQLMPLVMVNTPWSAAIGDSIRLHMTITPLTGDADSSNNNKIYTYPVINGYDPNDKQVYPKGECIPGYIQNDQLLTYTVRFQNTGNAEAINIHIIDSLSPALDLNTVRVVGKSHPMYTEVLPSNKLKFVFNNIQLPDSTSNEPQSHGYVIYEVKPLPGLPVGTAISNRADIYFDFNPPILTNTVLNTITYGNLGVTQTLLTQQACESYTLNGHTYQSSGTYQQTYSNLFGCDSTVTLNLIVHQPGVNQLTATACESYTLNGQTYTASGIYTQNLAGTGGCDSTVQLHLTVSQPTLSELAETACNSYTLNGQTYTQSGTYTQTLSNSAGCDSTVTLLLSINDLPNTGVTQSGTQLNALATGAGYQWIDCNTQQPIAGATGNSYTATANGSYAVVLTQNGCTDTSACYAITSVDLGVIENTTLSNIRLYPNPASTQLNISSPTDLDRAVLQILDLTGKSLLQTTVSAGTTYTVDISAYKPGLYMAQMSQNGSMCYIKWVKL